MSRVEFLGYPEAQAASRDSELDGDDLHAGGTDSNVPIRTGGRRSRRPVDLAPLPDRSE